PMSGRRQLLVTAALLLGSAAVPGAYALLTSHWPLSTSIVMQLELGPSPALIDGSVDWNAVASGALSDWNGALNGSGESFQAVSPSTAATGQGNSLNNVFFSNDVYGTAWGAGVLAVTLTSYTTPADISIESDVLVNKTL